MQGNTSISASGSIDKVLRTARWLDLGNRDPRLPYASLIELASVTTESPAFEHHEIPFPRSMENAIPKRRVEFVMGRLAARLAIANLGIVPSPVGIGPSREPLWQAGITGSISHTHELVAAVAVASSTVRGVGIDLEGIVDVDALDAIRHMAMTPDEQAVLEQQRKDISESMLVTIAFSAKESFFKGTFLTVGRFFDFSAVRVSHFDAASGRLDLTITEDLCPDLPQGRSFPLWFTFVSSTTVATSFIW